MSHREDLLEGAVRCLREKGYARTTARDIVSASGTNLASIGYHYGSTEALLNAAVVRAMDDFGAEIGRSMAALTAEAEAGGGGAGTVLERFERFWEHTIASFQANPGIWLATFDIFSVAMRNPEVRTTIADGLEDGRQLWAQAIYNADEQRRAIGSLHQAMLSGVLVQWLMDPERAPSAADLARALLAITSHVAADQANSGV
ncbi:MAG TPA: TetR/AcrR family transcriptional regulator [Streptosporangiaceae bacterium]